LWWRAEPHFIWVNNVTRKIVWLAVTHSVSSATKPYGWSHCFQPLQLTHDELWTALISTISVSSIYTFRRFSLLAARSPKSLRSPVQSAPNLVRPLRSPTFVDLCPVTARDGTRTKAIWGQQHVIVHMYSFSSIDKTYGAASQTVARSIWMRITVLRISWMFKSLSRKLRIS
jgi:hypothetical protein